MSDDVPSSPENTPAADAAKTTPAAEAATAVPAGGAGVEGGRGRRIGGRLRRPRVVAAAGALVLGVALGGAAVGVALADEPGHGVGFTNEQSDGDGETADDAGQPQHEQSDGDGETDDDAAR